jgi:hypothetical protein
MLNSIASFVLRSVISARKNAGCSKMIIARNALMNAIPVQMNAEKCPVCNFFSIPVKIFLQELHINMIIGGIGQKGSDLLERNLILLHMLIINLLQPYEF